MKQGFNLRHSFECLSMLISLSIWFWSKACTNYNIYLHNVMTHFATLLSQQNNVSLECSILCFIKLPCWSRYLQCWLSSFLQMGRHDSRIVSRATVLCRYVYLDNWTWLQVLLVQYKIFVSNISLFLSQSSVKRPWAEYVWSIVVLVFCGLASSQPRMIRVEEMPYVYNIRRILDFSCF